MIKKIVIALILVPLVAVISFMAALYFYQEQLIFRSEKLPADHVFTSEVPFKEINIPVKGAVLNALHFQQEKPRGLVFFLHGNSGNLKKWATNIDFYQRVNYDLFMVDYRGYGKSTGKIQNQEQLIEDIHIAWNTIAPTFNGKPIAIYGRSLGSALATELARKVNPDSLILVSPFSSMTAIAKKLYPYAPSWLLRYPLSTETIISEVSSRIILLHGDKDVYIPISHSHALQAAIPKPSQLITIKGANHSNIHKFPSYLDAYAKALQNIQ